MGTNHDQRAKNGVAVIIAPLLGHTALGNRRLLKRRHVKGAVGGHRHRRTIKVDTSTKQNFGRRASRRWGCCWPLAGAAALMVARALTHVLVAWRWRATARGRRASSGGGRVSAGGECALMPWPRSAFSATCCRSSGCAAGGDDARSRRPDRPPRPLPLGHARGGRRARAAAELLAAAGFTAPASTAAASPTSSPAGAQGATAASASTATPTSCRSAMPTPGPSIPFGGEIATAASGAAARPT